MQLLIMGMKTKSSHEILSNPQQYFSAYKIKKCYLEKLEKYFESLRLLFSIKSGSKVLFSIL